MKLQQTGQGRVKNCKGSKDPYWILSKKLIVNLTTTPKDYAILQENIATSLANIIDIKKANSFIYSNKAQLLKYVDQHAGTWRSYKFREKLERDLNHPYSDKEVLSHISELETEFKDKLNDIKQILISNSRPFPQKVYIYGSLVKGRIGKNSDLDVMLPVNERSFAGMMSIIKVINKRDIENKPSSTEHVNFWVAPIKKNNIKQCKNWFDPVKEIRLDITSDLWKSKEILFYIYKNAVNKKGLEISTQPNGEKYIFKTQKPITRTKEKINFTTPSSR